MTLARPRPHPPSETLTRFVEGTLSDRAAIAEVVEHLSTCWECRQLVEAAAAFEQDSAGEAPDSNPEPARPMLVVAEEGALGGNRVEEAPLAPSSDPTVVPISLATPSRRRPAMRLAAIAAAIVIALLLIPAGRRWNDDRRARAAMAELIAGAPKTQRTIEPRLSGGFAWAPEPPRTRAGGSQAPDLADLLADNAASKALDTLGSASSPAAQHAAGIALLMSGDAPAAIPKLAAAADAMPQRADFWNDLAAARYIAAVYTSDRDQLVPALAAVTNAIAVDSSSNEAYFNRALIIEELRSREEAVQAWQMYVARDAASPWSQEARTHLQQLTEARPR